jgi:predicted metal-dependent peptidase
MNGPRFATEPGRCIVGASAPAAGTPVDRAEIEEIALDRLEKARIDILLDHPYFASALLQLPLRGTWDPAIRHAVVTDGKRIVFRHDLVAALLRPKVRVLVLHALAHVLLDHPGRGGARAWPIWTAACDIAVDELLGALGEIEPPRVAFGEKRPAGRSAEEIYDELLYQERLRAAGHAPAPESAPAPPRESTDAFLSPTSAPHADEAEHAERDAFLRAAADSETLSAVDMGTLQAGFRHEATKAIRAAGNGAGAVSSEVAACERTVIPWRSELACFLRDPVDRIHSFARPNRKHLWRGIILPGTVPVEGGRVVVAIDTSGSMSDADLAQVLGEIDALRRTGACDLVVLQFDASIQAVAEFSPFEEPRVPMGSTQVMRMCGRGGTDLRLPFTWTEEAMQRDERISALVVCTDGFGPLPADAPDGLPVLFMLTPHHAPPSFGRQLVLPDRL